MKKTKLILAFGISVCLVLIIAGCKTQHRNYDKALQTPDVAGHGYNLTELGCLLAAPWSFNQKSFVGPVVTYNINGEDLPYKETLYTEYESNLVFEFQRNGTMKYWFKTDYLQPHDDTVVLKNGTKSIEHTILKSNQLKLKNIYTQGSWATNFKDSTVIIDFGKNDFGLIAITAKYTDLGFGRMVLEENSFLDSIYKGKLEKIKKTSTTYFKDY